MTTETPSEPPPWATRVSRIWHAALALLIAAAFLTQLVVLLDGGADATSGRPVSTVPVGTRLIRLFSYFTIESNLIVLAVAASLAVRPGRDGHWWRTARLDALLGIVVTGIVYALVLAGSVHLHGPALFADIAFHYIAPWATLAGWILLGPRPRISWTTVAAAVIWPLAWIAYTFAHGAATGWYPYPFLDAAAHGYATALVNTAFVVITAVVLLVLFRLADNLPAPRYVATRATRITDSRAD